MSKYCLVIVVYKAVNVLPDDGLERSETCRSLIFFKIKNIIVNHVTILCICWVKL